MAAARMLGFLLLTLPLVPPYWILLRAHRLEACRVIARLYWRATLRIIGVRVVIRGRICDETPVLFVSNHSSYLDIAVIGALLKACFVAKQEVRGWAGLGFLSRLARTVFIDRQPRESRRQRDVMTRRLIEVGDSLVLFPEGTTSDGNRVLPFKSSLFSVAENPLANGLPPIVQPVSITYTRLDGLPIGRTWRPFFAWYGNMELAPHLWVLLGLGVITAEVTLHPPVRVDRFGGRKALSEHCWQVVAEGVTAANQGRAGAEAEAPATPPADVAVG